MTRWDTDNLNAPHTQRELQQEWGGDGVSDLVKRLRANNAYKYTGIVTHAAADRIEMLEREVAASYANQVSMADRIKQLERELVEQVNKKVGYYNDWMAEKALAEFTEAIILKIINGPQVECIPDNDIQADIAAYRKARGL